LFFLSITLLAQPAVTGFHCEVEDQLPPPPHNPIFRHGQCNTTPFDNVQFDNSLIRQVPICTMRLSFVYNELDTNLYINHERLVADTDTMLGRLNAYSTHNPYNIASTGILPQTSGYLATYLPDTKLRYIRASNPTYTAQGLIEVAPGIYKIPFGTNINQNAFQNGWNANTMAILMWDDNPAALIGGGSLGVASLRINNYNLLFNATINSNSTPNWLLRNFATAIYHEIGHGVGNFAHSHGIGCQPRANCAYVPDMGNISLPATGFENEQDITDDMSSFLTCGNSNLQEIGTTPWCGGHNIGPPCVWNAATTNNVMDYGEWQHHAMTLCQWKRILESVQKSRILFIWACPKLGFGCTQPNLGRVVTERCRSTIRSSPSFGCTHSGVRFYPSRKISKNKEIGHYPPFMNRFVFY
jgi:hypothetical protein